MVRRATLKDVAKVAGVSTATVARVLHDKGYVAPETRTSVERALAESSYQINAVAQGLRRQRTFTIGHVMNSVIPNQFFAAVAEGVERIAAHHDCAVLMMTTHGSPASERSAVRTLIQRRVDAVIFTTATHVDNVRLAVDAGLPVVQVERMTSVETAMVTADNYGGAYGAVQHLIALGHRRIAFLGVDPAHMRSRPGSAAHPDVEQERLSGYLAALTDHRIPVDQRLIGLETGYTDEIEGGPRRGISITKALLTIEPPPTALFATFDLLAASALQVIHERGWRVPEDISVVGFDDTYAPYLAPPLTAVTNPMKEMGEHAARTIFRHLDGSATGREVSGQRIPMGLTVRSSTGPPRRHSGCATDSHHDGGVSSMTGPVDGGAEQADRRGIVRKEAG